MENNNGKLLKWVLIAITIGLIILYFCKDCKGETIKVEIPEIKGKFEAVKPITEPVLTNTEPIHRTYNNSNRDNNSQFQKLIDSLKLENQKLQLAFQQSKNKDSLYSKAIQLNSFSHTFEDTIVKIDANGISRGSVESLKIDYTIKPRTEKIKIPVTVFRLLSGVEIGSTKELLKVNFKFNLGIQNKRGNMLSVSIDTDQRLYIGYGFSLFSVKR